MIDFPKLLRLLTEHDVAFLIIGGVAAVIHGSSRLTQDLDVVYQRSPQNLTRLVQALAEQAPYLRGAPPGLPFQWSVATLRMGLNFTLETSVGPLDLLGEVTGGGSYEDLNVEAEEQQIPSGPGASIRSIEPAGYMHAVASLWVVADNVPCTPGWVHICRLYFLSSKRHCRAPSRSQPQRPDNLRPRKNRRSGSAERSCTRTLKMPRGVRGSIWR